MKRTAAALGLESSLNPPGRSARRARSGVRNSNVSLEERGGCAYAKRNRRKPEMKMPSKKVGKLQRSRGETLAQRTAAEYCLLNLPTLYTAGRPRPGLRANLWIVPIVIVRPGGDMLGPVGSLTVDMATATVVEASPKESVLAAGRSLAKVNANGAKAASGAATRKRG